MSFVIKTQFENQILEVTKVEDVDGQLWMLANPFARVLEYVNARNAVTKFVSENNQISLENIKAPRNKALASLHSKSKFINRAGLFELIQSSRMPKAQQFKQWINTDLLPKLCDKGEYSMAVDAPAQIAEGMNAVHAVTNDGQEAPWMKDLKFYKDELVKRDIAIETKDKAIAAKNEENQRLATALQTANLNLVEANKGLLTAFNIINEARRETAQLANRMADIAQDVIAKPANPQLCHSLAVCDLGNDQYAFVRPQRRSLKQSLNRLSIDERDIVFRSDYVPNAMNVLNKVKESIPRNNFKAKHNKITLLENYTKEQLMDVINSTMTERQIARLNNLRNN
ncbi:baculovirus repeated namegeneORF [Condylorrhiza vestigialis mutiple nucleopolyhedrovirus]|uniref:Baculovirus repeated namegeneORF n=1 Tax=Condylorrhiza vestigialis mutiple nucleopolyhedrovirus TaxID=1592576 RepID=A0A0B4UKT9_9ABAC|nr:baculovirus repeated namegeneORF [Condylorrhiza vestigialis mutiple nucleopolyhedrovirus]AJD09209.1 baculovirus repeated namegeneORF [Condylorrhiza vestigialis mutiple nucleopolyhedrovirus]